jgi:hypothetical protein
MWLDIPDLRVRQNREQDKKEVEKMGCSGGNQRNRIKESEETDAK